MAAPRLEPAWRVCSVTRILIADDEEVRRCGVRSMIVKHEGREVVAEAQDGK